MFHHDQLTDTCASAHTTLLYCGHFCVVEKRVTFSLLVFLCWKHDFYSQSKHDTWHFLTVEVSREQDIGIHRQAGDMPCSQSLP